MLDIKTNLRSFICAFVCACNYLSAIDKIIYTEYCAYGNCPVYIQKPNVLIQIRTCVCTHMLYIETVTVDCIITTVRATVSLRTHVAITRTVC